jgi:hypothetical protein
MFRTAGILVLLFLQSACSYSWAGEEDHVPANILPRWTPAVLDMVRSGERAFICGGVGVIGWDSPPDGSLFFFRNSTREPLCIFGGCHFQGRRIQSEICRQQCPPLDWIEANCDSHLRAHRISLRPDIDEARARQLAFVEGGCVVRQQRGFACDVKLSDAPEGWAAEIQYVGGLDSHNQSLFGKMSGVRLLMGRKGQIIEWHKLP